MLSPDLTLRFKYYLLVDKYGKPLEDPEDGYQYVPVLVNANHCGGDPKPEPHEKAYYDEKEGWCDPKTKKPWNVEDEYYCTPKDKWDTFPRNDLLEKCQRNDLLK